MNGPEVCEDGLPLLETCVSFGYDRGYLGCARCLPDVRECRFNSWQKMPITVSTIIRSIHGTGSDNVFAAGSDGALLRYDGARWDPLTPAAFDHFRAVFTFAPDHAIALGQLGTIQKWNGAAWSVMQSDATWRFNAVIGFGASDAFAVGNRGILRYDGTMWTTFAAPSANELTKIWGASPTDLYVIDSAGTLSHFSANSWQTVALPGSPAAQFVFGSGPGDVYVYTSNDLFQLVGTSWQRINFDFDPLFGTFIAGGVTSTGKYCLVGLTSAVVCSAGNNSYVQLTSAGSGFGDLNTMWATAADDIFIGGTLGIQHFQGSSFFVTQYASAPLDLWSDGSAMYGANGDVLKHTGGVQFSEVFTPPAGNDLYAVWGSAANDVFAVGQGGAIYRYNGSNWSKQPNSDSRTLHAVWGSAAANVYAVGTSGAILHYTGAWGAIASGTSVELHDVWGASATDVFVVGEAGTILHSTGGSFAPMTSGTTNDLLAVWGTAPNDVYAVGRAGTLLHYDGSAWSEIAAGTGATLNDVWGTSPSDVFIVGDLGVMLYFDGTRWTPVKRPFPNQLAVFGHVQKDELFISMAGTVGHKLVRLAPW